MPPSSNEIPAEFVKFEIIINFLGTHEKYWQSKEWQELQLTKKPFLNKNLLDLTPAYWTQLAMKIKETIIKICRNYTLV